MDSSSTNTDGLLKFLAWLDKNKKRVSLITAAAVAVVALIAAVIYYQSQKEGRASEALSNVRKSSNPSLPVPPGTAEAYLKVARDFEGTKAAGRALLEAASLYYTDGNYASAEAQYKRFLSEYPDSSFLPQGMLGQATTLDAAGKSAEAVAKFEELRRRFPSDSVIDEAKLSLARLYESQNPAEAFKLYNELVGLGANSGIGSEAGIRREDLLEKHPELVKTNAPPATTITPVPPPPAASTTATSAPNTVVMAITNFTTQTSAIPALSPTTTATGAAAIPPAVIRPAPATPATNKP